MTPFPFSAIVGQDEMKTAMILTATLLLPLTASPAAALLGPAQPAPIQDVATAEEPESEHTYPVTVKSTLSKAAAEKNR